MKRAAALALIVAGCGGFIDNQAAKSTLKILKASSSSAQKLPDVDLARDALAGGIVQLDAFAIAYPDHPEFKRMHAEALCQYAIAFVFDDWEDATMGGRAEEAAYLAGRLGRLLPACVEANLALLPPQWRAARGQGPDAITAILPTVTTEQVPALLLIATADAVTVPVTANLELMPSIDVMLRWCAELVPGSSDALAETMLGTLHAAASPFTGGPNGLAELETAKRLAPAGTLLIDVTIANAKRDKAALEKLVATDLRTWPERRLSNELALRKARRYLAAMK